MFHDLECEVPLDDTQDDQTPMACFTCGTLQLGWTIHPSLWHNDLEMKTGSFSYQTFGWAITRINYQQF